MTIKKDTISRRRFLALTSKTVCAGLLVGMPPLSQGIAAPRNAALIGYGQRGAGFWQQTILPHLADKIRLSYICDPDPAKQKLIHKAGPYRIVRHSHELMPNPDIDTLIIASPDNSHTPLIQNFISPKKQLLCELPLAISKPQYQQLSQRIKAGPNNIHPVLTERLRPVWKRIRTLITQNVIGDVLAVDFHVYRSQTHAAQIFRNWQGQADVTGSWLIHEGTRHFDLVNWWLDREPVAVSASGRIQTTNSDDIFQNFSAHT
ncbi:Gfo/Idh/MocA family oxidoreductase, partial [bacterium]|nr:Gfo/Idh/MocA family oxidoreductase [bacterium]